MTTASILALSAGLSEPSTTRMLADRLSGAARAALEARGTEVQVRTVELRELARDITDAMLAGFPSPRLAEVIQALRSADAVVAVTPIFNTGASGLFKSFVDVVPTEAWRGTPVVLGATAGTARHSLAIDYAIRPMFAYLKAETVPTAVFAASGDLGAVSPDEADAQPLDQRARRAAEELAAMLGAAAAVPGAEPLAAEQDTARESESAESVTTAETAAAGTHRDAEFDDFVPMDALLNRR